MKTSNSSSSNILILARAPVVAYGQAHLWEVSPGKEPAWFRYHVPIAAMLGTAFRRDLAMLAVRN
jgi:hypothetical protein